MASAAGRTLDVSGFLQGLSFNRYHLRVLVLCSLVTFFDGQDFSALALALPYIREDMLLTDDMSGYVSSAAFLGQMIGSLFGSYLGDIFGRRPVIITCTIGSAVFTTTRRRISGWWITLQPRCEGCQKVSVFSTSAITP